MHGEKDLLIDTRIFGNGIGQKKKRFNWCYIYIYTYNIYQQKGVIEQLPSPSLWPASQPGVGHGSCDWFGTVMHWNILFWKSIEKDNAKPGTYQLWFCMNWLSCFLSDVWKQTHVTGPFDAARTIQNLKHSASMNRDGRISPSFDSPSFADPNSELIAWVSSGEPQLFKFVLVSPTSGLSIILS